MGQQTIEVGKVYLNALPPYNKVMRNLYVGSVNALQHANKFDVIVNMAKEINTKKLGVPVVKVGLRDSIDAPLRYGNASARRVDEMAEQIAHWMNMGKKVLVICHAGLNRSNLMVGTVLLKMGYDPATIIARLRKRSPLVLSNQSFERFLYEAHERGL